mmetsp:Transcript_42183/g.117461  ORF Transcript_42183/g.117461 Transcript_42183/m.117461 type:complete len:409 (+) Transcript_42183:78-1304(+)
MMGHSFRGLAPPREGHLRRGLRRAEQAHHDLLVGRLHGYLPVVEDARSEGEDLVLREARAETHPRSEAEVRAEQLVVVDLAVRALALRHGLWEPALGLELLRLVDDCRVHHYRRADGRHPRPLRDRVAPELDLCWGRAEGTRVADWRQPEALAVAGLEVPQRRVRMELPLLELAAHLRRRPRLGLGVPRQVIEEPQQRRRGRVHRGAEEVHYLLRGLLLWERPALREDLEVRVLDRRVSFALGDDLLRAPVLCVHRAVKVFEGSRVKQIFHRALVRAEEEVPHEVETEGRLVRERDIPGVGVLRNHAQALAHDTRAEEVERREAAKRAEVTGVLRKVRGEVDGGGVEVRKILLSRLHVEDPRVQLHAMFPPILSDPCELVRGLEPRVVLSDWPRQADRAIGVWPLRSE